MQATKQLCDNIAKCLNDKHMTQSQLSVLSGVHESTICRILSGKREIHYQHLYDLSRGFGFESPASLIHYPEQIAIIKKLPITTYAFLVQERNRKRKFQACFEQEP